MDKNTLKSSFGKWVSPINTKKLFEQVEENKQDYYTKKLTTAAYIKLMLLAQLQGFESLEEMSDALIDDGLQKALGFESISTSQLSRKNNEMNPMILSHLFLDEVKVLQNKTFHFLNQQ
ncbi:DUF4372 domain-containing protein [Virgibacillus dokdonensis]|uniref:DUF4372 domain-containing protein n=1 Tax=Virgibacillus dokdonensis TaxID=302167 RepID=UPI000989FD81|nr:DUF4372 domain-containing protein [Virgibacillus dokdonensis]